MGLEAAAAYRKRKAESREPEANKSARISDFADASALDILASVAGIGASVPLASAAPTQRPQTTQSDSSKALAPVLPDVGGGGRQLAALNAASLSTRSSSSSSISTPSLAPISPAMGHRVPLLVSPPLCPKSMVEARGPVAAEALGARGGSGFAATGAAAPPLDLGLLISIIGAQT
jgi:hypothetical protein